MRTIKRSAGRKVKPQPTKPKRTIPKRHRIPPPPGGPPGSATDQEQPLVDLAVGGLAIGGASAQKLAQVCTVGATGWLTEVWFPLGCDAGDLIVEVHGVNGNVPDGTILASRSSIDQRAATAVLHHELVAEDFARMFVDQNFDIE